MESHAHHDGLSCSPVGLTLYPNSRSQSRMRGDYLFYEEKLEATQEERDLKAARRWVAFLPCVALPSDHCFDDASI